jgi:hypothetical protein
MDFVGQTLRKRFAKATKELARQQEGLEEFIEGQHDKVDAWKKAVDDFESGASLANPYELPQSGKRAFCEAPSPHVLRSMRRAVAAGH